jgi:porin
MHRLLIIFCGLLFIELVHSQNKFWDSFTFGTQVTGDFIINHTGGIKKGYTYIGKEDFTINFDTEKAKIWKNGTLFIHGLNTHGKGPSSELTGDMQVFSNIEAGDYTGLYEFWYSHQINNISILFGQHDLNTEFIGTRYGGTFINSSFGISPNMSLNVPVSIYPVAAPCILLKYENDKLPDLKLAIYDGDPGNFEDNRFNLKWSLSSKEGFLTISEVVFKIKRQENISGTIKAGGYFHSGSFLNYSDTLLNKKGNFGLYLIYDQNIFPRSLNAGRGLCFFFQGGYAPPDINIVEFYTGAGFRYHGILPNRFNDELGIAFARIQLSKYYRNLSTDFLKTETAIETTYAFHFNNRYTIQPSIQYIINPGANSNISNCLVTLMRFSLTY